MGVEHVLSRPRERWESRAPEAERSVLTHTSSHSGWVTALVVVGSKPAVAVLMLLVALLFTGIAVLGIVMLKRVRAGPEKVGLGNEIMGPKGGAEWNIKELGQDSQAGGLSTNGLSWVGKFVCLEGVPTRKER